MESAKLIGIISGSIVALSVIPYAIRTWQGKVTPVISSWSLWTVIALAILLSFIGSGANENKWTAVFGFTNPLIITVLAIWRKDSAKKIIKINRRRRSPLTSLVIVLFIFRDKCLEQYSRMNKFDKTCLVFGLLSLTMSFFMRGGEKHNFEYALYLAIIADAIGAVPTYNFLRKKPWEDRPFAWGLFGIGYCLNIFSITEHTLANYTLPTFMTLASGSITSFLIAYRIKNKIPLKEWI